MAEDPWHYIENPDKLTAQRLINILKTYPPDAEIAVAAQIIYATSYRCDALEVDGLLLCAIEARDTHIALIARE